MINPFALSVDWQALATFVTGIAAVGAALVVALKQDRLRRNETRVALLETRREVLAKFDRVSGQWWAEAKLDRDGIMLFQDLLRDIELVFDQSVYRRAETIFKDTVWQRAFESNINAYLKSQQFDKHQENVQKASKMLEDLCERLPQLRELLVSATQVGNIFR